MIRRLLILLAAVFVAAGAALLPATAAHAAEVPFGLLPAYDTSKDVAAVHGLVDDWGLNQRASVTLDAYEQWLQTGGYYADGIHVVYLRSKALGPGGQIYCMDALTPGKDTINVGDVVGTRPCNNLASQRWVREGHVEGFAFRNARSRLFLTMRIGVGPFPGYDQRPFTDTRAIFVYKWV